MKKPKLIKHIIQKYEQYENNRPKYKISDLLVATINKATAKGHLPIRNAICIISPKSDRLQPLNTKGLPHYYVQTNIHYLEVVIPEYMKEHNWTPNSKLSLMQIDDIEKELNKNNEYNIRFN